MTSDCRPFFFRRSVDERQAVTRQAFVKNRAAGGRVDDLIDILADGRTHHVLIVVLQRQVDEIAPPAKRILVCVSTTPASRASSTSSIELNALFCALHLVAGKRQVIAAENDVL